MLLKEAFSDSFGKGLLFCLFTSGGLEPGSILRGSALGMKLLVQRNLVWGWREKDLVALVSATRASHARSQTTPGFCGHETQKTPCSSCSLSPANKWFLVAASRWPQRLRKAWVLLFRPKALFSYTGNPNVRIPWVPPPRCAGFSLCKSVIRRHAMHHPQGLYTN